MGTATTAEAVSCDPTVTTSTEDPAPSRTSNAGQQRTDRLAGVDESGRRGRRADRGPPIELEVPQPGAHVEQPGGRRVGRLGRSCAGQPVRRCRSGISSTRSASSSARRESVGGQLVDGVERRGTAGRCARYSSSAAITAWTAATTAGRAGVAVVVRRAEQVPTAQQPVVDGPRVDADAAQSRCRRAGLDAGRRAPGGRGRGCPSAGRQAAAPGSLREAGDRVQGRAVRWSHVAEDHPTARGAEVDGGDGPVHVRGSPAHRRNAAATPASTGMCSPVVWLRSRRAQDEDGVGDVLGQHLALEQRALGVERAEVVLGDPVDGGALGTPAAGEDARSRARRRRG